MPAVLVEGAHTPDALAGASGVYIAASGSAMLQSGIQNLRTMEHWLWLAVESGTLELENDALPSQLNLAKHIVQATVRVASAEDASSAQLQQLLWAMLASHSGQPVAMDAVLSHEIAKVVDAMRKIQYRDSFSLNDMAALSRMPVETFRKRFVSEVGMPPQSYQLFCKMERAKVLLKEGYTVRQAGIEVGMNDPYHFSKTFKNIVGMSPSAYSKTALK